jgi:predicted transcriptional regulator
MCFVCFKLLEKINFLNIIDIFNMLPELTEIKKRRRMLGLHQSELASFAGVSQSLVAKIESNKVDPSYSHAKKLFMALESIEKKNEPRLQDIMTHKVIGIQPNEPVLNAIKLMKQKNISQLPVFKHSKSIASISEETILHAMSEHKDINKLKVLEIADSAFPELNGDIFVSAVLDLFEHTPAILVTKKGAVIGIVTKADLLKIR